MSLKKMVDMMFKEIREAVLTGGKKFKKTKSVAGAKAGKGGTKKNRKSVNLFKVMDEVDSLNKRMQKLEVGRK